MNYKKYVQTMLEIMCTKMFKYPNNMNNVSCLFWYVVSRLSDGSNFK